jgi:hypothetical protein
MTTPEKSTEIRTALSVAEHLSGSAQRTLTALRAALDQRLAALEEALANPARGDSLEDLILDLARAAGDEAQVAASKACLDTKAEADREIAQILASARAALEQERADSAELRRAVEQAKQHITTVEHETRAGRLAREHVEGELAHERERVAALQAALAETQSQLEAARTSTSEIRLLAESAGERMSTAESEKVQILTDREELAAQLDRQREDTAKATQALVDAQIELESARVELPVLRADLDAARLLLEALATEREAIAVELQAARKWIDELRDAEAEFAALSTESDTPTGEAPDPRSQVPTPWGDEEEWHAVRLASRYAFRQKIEVHINGEPGALFDLSIGGCQILSASFLKPNQVVKVLLPAEQNSIVCMGKIVWIRVEPSAAGRPFGYRAGVHFTQADASAIEEFAARHGALR